MNSIQDEDSEVYNEEFKLFYKETMKQRGIIEIENKLYQNTDKVLFFLTENLKKSTNDISIKATRRSQFRQKLLEDLIHLIVEEAIYEARKIKDKSMNIELFEELAKLKDFDLEKKYSISLKSLQKVEAEIKDPNTVNDEKIEERYSFSQRLQNLLLIIQNNIACHFQLQEKNNKSINKIIRAIEIRKVELRRSPDFIMLAVLNYNQAFLQRLMNKNVDGLLFFQKSTVLYEMNRSNAKVGVNMYYANLFQDSMFLTTNVGTFFLDKYFLKISSDFDHKVDQLEAYLWEGLGQTLILFKKEKEAEWAIFQAYKLRNNHSVDKENLLKIQKEVFYNELRKTDEKLADITKVSDENGAPEIHWDAVVTPNKYLELDDLEQKKAHTFPDAEATWVFQNENDENRIFDDQKDYESLSFDNSARVPEINFKVHSNSSSNDDSDRQEVFFENDDIMEIPINTLGEKNIVFQKRCRVNKAEFIITVYNLPTQEVILMLMTNKSIQFIKKMIIQYKDLCNYADADDIELNSEAGLKNLVMKLVKWLRIKAGDLYLPNIAFYNTYEQMQKADGMFRNF